ncbi:MAG TPA: hypothetical protein VLE19_09710 [Pyrinomonadaceae bacterium]|nr:hypothetical protein [Pyrinomonadaceae bacterium]
MAKLSKQDATIARILKIAPWVSVIATSLPGPILFLFLFLTTAATDSAAVYLLLAGLSLAVGFALGLLIAAIFLIYRRRWLIRLRERLASDGITASEVVWFRSELTSAERAALDEIQQSNPLLADAYLETLASRLTASRMISRSKREILRVERRLNRARAIGGDTIRLQEDLTADRERLDQLRQHATQHLGRAKARLQEIEATASRNLNEVETEIMMQRLGVTQDQLPLALEMAQFERQALKENQTLNSQMEPHGE